MKLWACALLALAACGDDKHTFNDAPGPCWPLPSTPGGTVQMGTGDITWEPMPDPLPIVQNGSQSDPYIEVHARMTGMPPGDPTDALNPKNPKTKVSGVIPSLNMTLGVMCPGSLGYVPSPGIADSYDLVHSLRIGFGTAANASLVAGHQITITLEVVGSNGLYAMDQKTVTIGSFGNGLVDAAVDAPRD